MTDQRGDPPPPPPRWGEPPLVLTTHRLSAMIFIVVAVVGFAISSANHKVVGQLICGAVFALATSAIVISVRRRRELLRVFREGTACPGDVVKSWTSTTDGRSSSYVEYRYDLPEGSFTNRYETYGEWEQKPIWVIYDPARPQRSVPVR